MMGKVIMSGIVPQLVAPVTGILAGDLAVGSSVYLMEKGVAVEYLVVNQGIPSGSSLYDASCNGTWLLRKDIKENRQWHSSDVNDYQNSTIHAWLNGDFFNTFGSIEQEAIKQVKIPYARGSGGSGDAVPINSGANGLDAKIFLLSGYEVGFSRSVNTYVPADGDKLDYFISGDTSGGANRAKRIAYLNSTAAAWWLRSMNTSYTGRTWYVQKGGGIGSIISSHEYGIRPALVLPYNALFDKKNMQFIGIVK